MAHNDVFGSPTESLAGNSAYFEPLGVHTEGDTTFECFQPTEHTHGAWGEFQHGSPPAALLTRALERCEGVAPGMRTTRIAVDLLGAVPYTELRVRSWVSRPGRQICKVDAELLAEVKGTWRAVASAAAWRMQVHDTDVITRALERDIPGPEQCPAEGSEITGRGADVPLLQWDGGFIRSIRARCMPDPDNPEGPMIHWVRTDHPVVSGEEPTTIERLMSVVDTANGIGATLDPKKWAFMNTDLVVHLHREPTPGWFGISARGSIGPDGIGMTAGELYDEHGPVGRSVQTLLVRPQPE
ncbi:thioesterase family protein [Corynebacterium sp. TAE3-ERU12]|uniref:thioesterase family protein n=1 Tax=Corynebacterium sp. TAE3-ERU12 TaxID=2849491 RepID=UPI001C46E835|nr:thioesterase family protein [Corynebacterium sp. TAE3-ERU12]MBV7295460.1 thioesterase family protein [Corynebacterium sp. TAE3-ERU12]